MSAKPLVFNVYDTQTNEYILTDVSYGPITELTGMGKSWIKRCYYEGELLAKRYLVDKADGQPTEDFIKDYAAKWDRIRFMLNPQAVRG